MTIYDAGTNNKFASKVSFNIVSPLVTAILKVACTEEKALGTYYFACSLVTGTYSLVELYFEMNPSTFAVRKVNETSYYRYKDFAMLDIKMNGSFIVGPAIGINQSQSAVLVYRRQGQNGSAYLYGGIDPSSYNYEDIKTVDVQLYNADSISKVYLQPKEGKIAYSYRLDSLKAKVVRSDLTSVQGGTITPSDSIAFKIDSYFTESQTGTGSTTSTGTTDAANASGNTGLLIGLIVGVIVVVLAIAAIIAYVIWKQGRKTKGSQYKDSQRDISIDNNSQTNMRSFDGVKY